MELIMAKITAEEREQTKVNIINASRVVFREHGFQKTTIKMVAQKAGVGVSTIYGYFPSKLDLFIYSFLQLKKDIEVDEAIIIKELKKGLAEGLCSLVLDSKYRNVGDDRQLLKAFYVASVSDFAKNKQFKGRMRDDSFDLGFIQEILEMFERDNIRLCAFSLKAMSECILTIVHHIGIDYLLFDKITYEETRQTVISHFKVLFAGKYENI